MSEGRTPLSWRAPAPGSLNKAHAAGRSHLAAPIGYVRSLLGMAGSNRTPT